MITVIYGKKGSGKTKRIIDQANESIKVQKGDVLFIDDDNRYMFDLRHEIRFINAGEYSIRSAQMFYGFVCGLLAQNFDVSLVFVDAFLKLCGGKVEALEELFNMLEAFSNHRDVKFVLSVSGDPDTMPEFVKKHTIQTESLCS